MPDFTRATSCTPEIAAEIDKCFDYAPWDDAKIKAGKEVRYILAEAVKRIIDHVPPCPDRSAAIRKLREARMDCNSAITHEGKY